MVMAVVNVIVNSNTDRWQVSSPAAAAAAAVRALAALAECRRGGARVLEVARSLMRSREDSVDLGFSVGRGTNQASTRIIPLSHEALVGSLVRGWGLGVIVVAEKKK